MRENALEDGWQRFLERLRRLWGKLRGNACPDLTVNATVGA